MTAASLGIVSTCQTRRMKSICQLVVVVQLLSHVWLLATAWTAACQASLSLTIPGSLPKFISIKSVMPSNRLILCFPLLLLPLSPARCPLLSRFPQVTSCIPQLTSQCSKKGPVPTPHISYKGVWRDVSWAWWEDKRNAYWESSRWCLSRLLNCLAGLYRSTNPPFWLKPVWGRCLQLSRKKPWPIHLPNATVTTGSHSIRTSPPSVSSCNGRFSHRSLGYGIPGTGLILQTAQAGRQLLPAWLLESSY